MFDAQHLIWLVQFMLNNLHVIRMILPCLINTSGADMLAPCEAKLSAAMGLNMQDKSMALCKTAVSTVC